MPEPQIAERASLRYRPDIDGLRAIAVVPVVLYHYGVPGFTGGFVGVDVFFVISGYLITALIAGEIATGEFSVLKFYERRVRRIFPALFAMIAAATIAAAILFFPGDLMRFAESVAATTIFGSNFDFWLQSGYFDASADVKPLLHTWSLAVEEQYYVVFPALLWLMRRSGRAALLALVGGLAVVSFVLSVWCVRAYPDAAFYLAPYRTWELMLGALLALGAVPAPKSPWARDMLGIVGLWAIAWAIFTFTAHTPFPGENALFPCVGAGLLILSGEREGGTITRLLSLKPIVFIGLVSYSLYLWHWPVHVFATYASPAPLSAVAIVALITLSFALGVLSWRYVERPFRAGRHLFTRGRLFALAAIAMTASVAVAGTLYGLNGLPQRFPEKVQRILAEASDFEPRRHGCFNRTPEQVARGAFCTIGDAKAAKATFLLWGDSHADALLPAIDAAAARAGRKGYFIGHGRCPPILSLMLTDEPTLRCARLNEGASKVARSPAIATVILAARWAYYDRGSGYGLDASETRHLIDLAPGAPKKESQSAAFARMLERTVRILTAMGKKVVLVAPVPEVGVPVPETLARIALQGRHDDIRPTVAAYRARQADVLADLAYLQVKYGATVVHPAGFLCAGGRCAVEKDGRPLYVDHHHLSVYGAMQISGLFAGIF
jgi:peptidoglycan/LPS O-acetylase OafA/YrhL